jgi:hypothetical protein
MLYSSKNRVLLCFCKKFKEMDEKLDKSWTVVPLLRPIYMKTEQLIGKLSSKRSEHFVQ